MICKHCGLEIEPAAEKMDCDWIHVNGWYACFHANGQTTGPFALFRPNGPLAEPKED